MSYVVTKNHPGKGGHLDIPAREDGSPFKWAAKFDGGARLIFFDDVVEAVGVLCGEPTYASMTEQERLVCRIKHAVKQQVWAQSALVYGCMQRGEWDGDGGLTEIERGVLLAPRYEQPFGWSTELLGFDHWSASACPLILVSTGYYDRPAPQGSESCLWWIDPITEEDYLQSLSDCYILDFFTLSD